MIVETLHFQLKRPLLVMKAPNGFLACGYINVQTCDKLEEACAIVSGVSDFEEMKSATIVAVSKKALALGINVGDTGEAALKKFQ
ncbi:MAG: YunC family protein [Rhodocyclaceae bacterium]|nr:YunC family protein [Rhodocyclaceae bacterium]